MKHHELYCDNIENVENYEKAKADNFKGWQCPKKEKVEIK